jgi:hypothetical protein
MSETTYVPTPQTPAGIVASLNGRAYVYLTPINGAVVQYNSVGALVASVGKAYDYFTPLTGTTITLVYSNSIVNPAGTIAALTINLPAITSKTLQAGQKVVVSFSQVVTALTVATTDGSSIIGTAITAGTVGGHFAYIYDSNSNAWYPA